MDESVGVVPIRTDQSQRLTKLISRADPIDPEGAVDLCRLESEDADGDAADLIMTECQKLSVTGKHLHEITFFRLSFDTLDGA